MKPKIRGWKEGVLTKDILSYGDSLAGRKYSHKKGSVVRYRRFKVYDSETNTWTGKYEWHYLDQNNYNLVRMSELFIKGNVGG